MSKFMYMLTLGGVYAVGTALLLMSANPFGAIAFGGFGIFHLVIVGLAEK